MAEHTPTPWQIYDDVNPLHIAIKWHYSDIGGAHVADVLSPANAEFIVKAVNNHADMVACVRASLNMVEGDGLPPDWDFLRQTLAKASA